VYPRSSYAGALRYCLSGSTPGEIESLARMTSSIFMSISAQQVAAHVASSIVIVAAAVLVSGFVALFAARRYGGPSRRRRQLIFLLVGGIGLLCSGGLMFLRLQFAP
jgi:drug/metabolite transporter (DMT)-like permease